MRSESKRAYQTGFELSEQELRRLYDTILQQLKRMPLDYPLKSTFEVKFRNGVIAEPTSIDEILNFENLGSGSITSLQFIIAEDCEKPKYRTFVEFSNADENLDSDNISIFYSISGDDRDWVFVTSSQIEERISKIKKVSLGKFTRSRQTTFFLPIISMVAFLLYTMKIGIENQTHILQGIENIETQWIEGNFQDPIGAILSLERLKAKTQISEFSSNYSPLLLVGLMIALPLLFIFFGRLISYFVPDYMFMWGDYVGQIHKRKSFGNFILIGIVLATAISIFGNYLSNLIGIGK